tara:strand:+ start:125932 stop:126249 length:318 start_codon:yes stop_codon:yes gene_type:complete
LNKSILNHANTPLFLQAVNSELAACLSTPGEDFSTDRFRYLCDVRHKVVVRALARLDPDVRHSFAKEELEINNNLEKLAQGLLLNAKDEAVKFSRGRSAVKKYNK